MRFLHSLRSVEMTNKMNVNNNYYKFLNLKYHEKKIRMSDLRIRL